MSFDAFHMPFDSFQLITIATVLLFASVVQSAVGFGMGLITVPILLWSGVALPHAVVIVISGTAIHTAAAAVALRREVPWRLIGVITAVRSIGMVVGVVLLGVMAAVDISRIKQIIGALLAVVVVSQWLWKPAPRQRIGAPWSGLAILLSGIMAAAVGMGGPPMVLWVLAHRWTAVRIRAVLLATFLLSTPVLLAMLGWKFGYEVLAASFVGLLNAPVLLVGNAIGLRIGRRLQRELLQKLALGLLAVLALASLAAPWLP